MANENQLTKDLDDFLNSSATNVEVMSDSLREQLNVKTGLEDVVRAAIADERSIVIAGTAGSGKTHLLQTIGAPPRYEVITDLAAYSAKDWPSIFGKNRHVIVAGNEGAFLQGSHKGLTGFTKIVELLHAIQKGQDPKDEGGPTVIDAAGFDPSGSHVIAQIVQLEALKTFGSQLPEIAALSWQMFSEEAVRRRLAVLVQAASAESGSDGFTFRQLWQFVGELLHVEENRDEPWFSRLFAGTSEVARRINYVFTPSSLALPHIGNQLWHGDFIRLRGGFLDGAVAVLERLLADTVKEQTPEARMQLFRTLRILAAFGLKASPIDKMLDSGVDLWSRVRGRDPVPLLQAINRYFAFGLIDLGDDLELWLQHDTERRDVKPDVQISLGEAKALDFSIRRSNVVANRPQGVDQIEGGRLLLVHNPTRAVLSVTKDLVDGILRTRSHRTHERRDVEYDWRITRFFEQVAAGAARPDRLKAARFDFQARTGQLMAWQVGSDRIRRVVT